LNPAPRRRGLLDSSARALAELGTVVRGIRPAVLADRALAGYFAVREVLAHVVKDSGARRVWIDVRHDDDMLRLGVTHDGTSPATAGGLHGVERLLAAAAPTASGTRKEMSFSGARLARSVWAAAGSTALPSLAIYG
jgi:hypothetical protein